MKRMNVLIIVALTTALAICAYGQVRQKVAKQVQVTTQTIESQPAGKPYIIDLTRGGTVYTIDAGIDLDAVEVRTRGSKVTLREIIEKLDKNMEMKDMLRKSGTLSRKLLIGLSSDVLSQDLPMLATGRSVGYTCSGAICTCTTLIDCFRMGTEGICSDITTCDETGCHCSKSKKLSTVH